MKKIFILILIFVSAYKVQSQVHVNFCVVADADDWQLFMSKKILFQLEQTCSPTCDDGEKVVFITLTAGDEGYGTGSFGGGAIAYYLAKERGAVSSSKFASDISNSPIYPLTYAIPTAQTVALNGKTLTKYVYGNANGHGRVVNYFLRLPDGGAAGAGFAGTGLKSLMKLKLGTIPNITSVDGVNTYTWTELLNTIRHIIFAEKGTDLQVWLNTADLSALTNPGDHSDHFYSATAAQEAVPLPSYNWVGINEFVMDHSSNLAENLVEQEISLETGAFSLYNWSLMKNRYPSKLTAATRLWLSREYFTQKRLPTGSAGVLPVTLLSFSGALKGKNVLLEWSTTSELNSKEFEIEKSNDGITYRKLGTVAAAGFSSSLKKYGYLDIEATDINYYRLKMVDLDGYNKQSDIVIIKNKLSQSVSVVNNPFKDYINVRFAQIPKGGITLRLIDLSGKVIQVSESYQPSLSSIIRFDLNSAISEGIYILQVENEGKQYSIKVIKQ